MKRRSSFLPFLPFLPFFSGGATLITLSLFAGAARADPCTGAGCDPDQGTRIHGTATVEHVNVALDSLRFGDGNAAPKPGCFATAARGALEWTNPACPQPPDFSKARFGGVLDGRVVTFKVVKAAPHTNWFALPGQLKPTPAAAEYVVEWSDQPGIFNPLCPTGNGTGNNPALVVPGAWSTSGDYLQSPHHFTFACLPERQPVNNQDNKVEFYRYAGGGVSAKCVDWGYPPYYWAPTPLQGKTAGQNIDVNTHLAKFDIAEKQYGKVHETCVRMATADFCGEGKPNTINGTPIRFSNVTTVAGAASPPRLPATFPQSPSMSLEAAWGVDHCGRVRAICLSKKRWQSLPLDGVCASARTLPDPRVNDFPASAAPPNVYRKYCDDSTLADLEKGGALLYSYSSFIDQGLYRFQDKSTGTFLTTTSVAPDTVNPLTPVQWLALGYTLVKKNVEKDTKGDFQYVDFEGPIFTLDKNTPIPYGDFLGNLSRCDTAGGAALTLTAAAMKQVKAPDQCVKVTPIGRIYLPENAKKQPLPSHLQVNLLRLWIHTAGGKTHYATSIAQPAAQYRESDAVPLGYLPPLDRIAP